MNLNILRFLCIFLALSCFVKLTTQECIHDQIAKEVDEIPDEEADPEGHADGRMLSTGSWGGLRIKADFSNFRGTASSKAYIQNSLLPAAFSYFKAALKVKTISTLKTTSSSLCGLSVPSVYRSSGVAADLVLFVTAENSASSWVAWALPCQSLSGNGRAIFGQINFNMQYVNPQSSRGFEQNLMTTLHEMTHVLGFSQSLFPKFLNRPRIGSKVLDGMTTSYLDIAPLTSMVRSHFGCSSAVAYLENQGGSGSAGSHFERRTFANEYMTASAVTDLRISKFTLALLEGSGWYQVNYNKADQFHWGKGEGCGFVNGQCRGQGFAEFCSTNGASGCNFHRTHGSYCSYSDSFSDNCPYMAGYSNHDCSNPAQSGQAAISGEYFGVGSRCFTGSLYSGGYTRSKRPYCMKYSCVKSSSGSWNVKINVGGRTATCTKAGAIAVSGYSGSLDCPNPSTFCTGVGIKFCKKGCLGRGTCSSGVCQCNSGYSGSYCQTRTARHVLDTHESDMAPEFNPDTDVIYDDAPVDEDAPVDDNADAGVNDGGDDDWVPTDNGINEADDFGDMYANNDDDIIINDNGDENNDNANVDEANADGNGDANDVDEAVFTEGENNDNGN